MSPAVNEPAKKRPPRVLAAMALLVLAATFLLAQIDFARRHRIGIAPERRYSLFRFLVLIIQDLIPEQVLFFDFKKLEEKGAGNGTD